MTIQNASPWFFHIAMSMLQLRRRQQWRPAALFAWFWIYAHKYNCSNIWVKLNTLHRNLLMHVQKSRSLTKIQHQTVLEQPRSLFLCQWALVFRFFSLLQKIIISYPDWCFYRSLISALRLLVSFSFFIASLLLLLYISIHMLYR